MLELEDLRAGYGNIEALHGISLSVGEGEIVTLIGANGAGKTTTLMTISGCVRARTGAIRFRGRDISGLPPHDIVALGLVQSPEGRKIFPRLSVAENLEMGAFTRRDPDGIAADQNRVFELFPILGERRRQPGGTLSGGEQQMLAIARALMARPRLAPLVVSRIFEVIRELNRDGATILLVEQNAQMALKAAHRGYVLETGTIAMADAADKLLADPRVRSAYLGDAG
jgi:branched-chain amino acid transport system ATP-binding protein